MYAKGVTGLEKDTHLTADDLGALAEGRTMSRPGTEAERHLGRCAVCFNAYFELVSVRVEADLRPRSIEARQEWVAQVLRTTRRRNRGGPSFWSGRLALAAAAAVVLLGVWWLSQELTWRGKVAPIREAVSLASNEGMIYPGVDPAPSPVASPYRSGRDVLAASLDPSLSDVRKRFREAPDDKEAAYWLAAGLTVLGQVAEARSVVDAARVRDPEDSRLMVMDAILAASERDYLRSRNLLEGSAEGPFAKEALRNLEILRDSLGVSSP